MPWTGPRATLEELRVCTEALDWSADDPPMAKGPFPDVVIPMPSEQRMGTIYFIRGAGAIKIGFASSLVRRMASLQTGSPVTLEVIASFKGTMAQERQIHAALAEYRLQGEWFQDTTAVVSAAKRFARNPLA
jgi:hypothetical protein